MKKLSLLLLAAACFSPVMAIDKIALPNGSFEKLNAVGDWPDGWAKDAKIRRGKLQSGDAADGKYFLHFDDGYGVLGFTTKAQDIANSTVELSANVRGGSDAKFGMLMLYKVKNARTGKVAFYTHRSVWDKTLTGKWQKFTDTLKLREDAVAGDVIIAFYRSNQKGFLEIDDVKFKLIAKGSAPAAAHAVKAESKTAVQQLPGLPNEVRTAITPFGMYLVLPEMIYAAPCIETNIFFENVVDTANINAYAVEVKCPVGKHYTNRWAWTPRKEDAGKTFELEMRLFNDYGQVISGKTRIYVAKEPADYKKPIRLALLGDSLLLCQYPERLRDIMKQSGFVNYVPVGSYTPSGKIPQPGDMAHDAYGGFAWGDFLKRWKYSIHAVNGIQDKAEREQMIALGVINVPKSDDYRMRSPLLRLENGKPVLDIPNWLKRINNGKAPDFIIIELGGNDVFSASAERLDEYVASSMRNARKLLAELRKHAPDSQIGVTTGQVGCSQDGFGLNYGCRQSSYQYRRNIQRYNLEITRLVKSLNDPAIEMVPIHHNIDSVNSYIKKSRNVHSRSKVTRMTDVNALHPNLEGGYQVADSIYGWLRKKLEK